MTEYNLSGIKISKPMDLNPKSNSSIVYNPANSPTNPGSLFPGQSISDLTFVSGYSQRRIRITMNPIDNPFQTAGSIAVIDEFGTIIWTAGDEPTDIPLINRYISGIFLQDDRIGQFIEGPDLGTVYNSALLGVSLTASLSSTGWAGYFSSSANQHVVDIVKIAGSYSPLGLSNDVTEWTHFKKMIDLEGNTIYVGDGHDPNGVLSGNKGDICLDSSATGQMAYCTGTTNWNLL
jgi:hypothetical protein